MNQAQAQTVVDPVSISGMNAAVTRIIEGSPVIVVILSALGYLFWRTWRSEITAAHDKFSAERKEMQERWENERKELIAKWQADRLELMNELREERDSRALAYREMAAVGDRATQATLAVRDALHDLKEAIRDGERGR